MFFASLILISAAFAPFSQGELLEDDLKLLKEFNPRTKRGACEDKVEYCDVYKNYCEDDDYKDYLKENCQQTCGFCVEECLDSLGNCGQYMAYCDDPNYEASMRYYCSETCGFCKVPTPPQPPMMIARTEQPIDQGNVECGTKAVGTRIVGGTIAKPGAWPWQVTVANLKETDQPHWCGGSIVSPQWIVSAAHCFPSGSGPKDYAITAGEHDLNGREGYEQTISIEKIIVHPEYNDFDYDLALIKLQSPLVFNNRVRPVCLPKFDFDVDTKCYVTGWGHTSESGDISQLLQQARVPLISRDTCQEAYGDLGYTISSRMRCAGYAKGGIDACQGDSGGPMVCSKDDKWYLMGAVSWGIGCARIGRYGVYADMLDLKHWVQETINKDN